MKYIAEIYVTFKEGVLDPQGVAVTNSLHDLGYNNVDEVRVGKYITVDFEAIDLENAAIKTNEMCEKLLVNSIIEEYTFDIEEVI